MPASELPPFRHHYHATGKGAEQKRCQPASYPHSGSMLLLSEGSRAEGAASESYPIQASSPCCRRGRRAGCHVSFPIQASSACYRQGAEQRVPASSYPHSGGRLTVKSQGLSCPHCRDLELPSTLLFPLWHRPASLPALFADL